MEATTAVSMRDRLAIDYGWTARQREVLDLLARGRSNQEVADALGISRDGAKYHVNEILSKLGSNSREEAAEYWRRYNGVAPRFARVFRAVAASGVWKWVAGGAAVVGVAAAALLVVALNDDAEDGGVQADTEPTRVPSSTPTALSGPPQERWQYHGTDQYVRVAASSEVVFVVGGRTDINGRGTGGTVTLLERDTGAERWRREVDCAPLYPAVDAERAYFPCTDGTVRGLNIDDGDEAWRAGPEGAPVFLIADGERVYAAEGDPERYDLDSVDPPTGGPAGRLRALDAATGELKWEVATNSYTTFITQEGARMYASTSGTDADGNVMAIDTVSGDVLWQTPFGSASSRPYVDGDAVYAAVSNGQLARFEAKDGTRIWAAEVPGGGVFQSPVVIDDVVVAGSNANSVFRLSATDGSILGKTNYCDCPYGGVRFGDGVLVFGSSLGVLAPTTLTPVFSFVPQGQVRMAVVANGWIFAPLASGQAGATVIAFH